MLLAAGLIAGEALIGLLFAFLAVMDIPVQVHLQPQDSAMLLVPAQHAGVRARRLAADQIPTGNAGRPDEPAPPRAMA